MVRTCFAAVILGVAALAAADDSLATRMENLKSAVDRIASKAGIRFDGEFRSQFLMSDVDGEGVAPDRRSSESVEFTSVDFDITARPNDAIGGRLVFRLHQNWQNFFSDVTNPIFSRWISIDGAVAKMFSYHAGDFRKRYSPLTLWSPDVDIVYEPDIFAGMRRQALAEEFLGGNDRLLQGVNAVFDAEIFPVLRELHLDLLGARLRAAETSNQSGSSVSSLLEKAMMDRYLLGANLDLTILPALTIGATGLRLFDTPQTYEGARETADTLVDRTTVWAVRAGVGTPAFLDTDLFTVSVNGEAAGSSDDSAWYRITPSPTAADTLRADTTLEHARISDIAVTAGLEASVAVGRAGAVRLSGGWFLTGPDFRNVMAQSPSFYGQRVMNLENDLTSGALYSSFDALYRHVFKFTPSVKTNDWVKAPMRKISYTRAIMSWKELATVTPALMDPAVQLVMPYGPATPNRTGVNASLCAAFFNKGVTASATLLSASQAQQESVMPPVLIDSGEVWNNVTFTTPTLVFDTVAAALPLDRYLQLGGGISVDVASFVTALKLPLRINGGFSRSALVNDGLTAYPLTVQNVTADIANAGIAWTFWKRASALFGYQRLALSVDGITDLQTVTKVESRWAGGLQYTVGEGGTLTGLVSRNDVTFDSDDPSLTGATAASTGDFAQMQYELFLTVGF